MKTRKATTKFLYQCLEKLENINKFLLGIWNVKYQNIMSEYLGSLGILHWILQYGSIRLLLLGFGSYFHT